jgi:hydroxymethylbilane synthase
VLLARPGAIDEAKQAAGETLPLKDRARIGTSAARRQAQLKYLRPDLEIVDLRGNVPTRVNRLREGNYDAILLARAGLIRLELDTADLFVLPLDEDKFVPAPAQGMLGIQCRDEADWRAHLAKLDCPDAGRGVAAERDLLQRLEGGCQLPFGINIKPVEDGWKLEAFLASLEEGPEPLRFTLEGPDLDALKSEAWDRLKTYQNG